ncbi:MAG: aminoglycoside phosphotransferase family protein [Actinomycetota bacterium]
MLWNRRFVLDLVDGQRAFAKVAAFDYTGDWLRQEHAAYRALAGEPFLPQLLGWYDDGEHPALVLEDLSEPVWPPPWNAKLRGAVLDALERLRRCDPPPGALEMTTWRTELASWDAIAEDPSGVLGLNLFSRTWLDLAIESLRHAESDAPLEGTDTLHMDVRSDNLCARRGAVLLVDWNWTSVGNGTFDVACWLPSLESEGGPPPEHVMPDAHPGFAALLAGYFARHAAMPPIDEAPHVRGLQLAQARPALRWSARLLGLPPPDPR